MLKLSEVMNELRVTFPQDDATVTRLWAAALVNEDKAISNGRVVDKELLEKANSYLEKAIAAEAAAA